MDEFHRLGARRWFSGYENLALHNPQAKILGLTATNIRGTDKRDMAKELFNGEILDPLSLPKAWSDGILPIPKYVSSLWNVDEIVEEELDKIPTNKKIELGEQLLQLKSDWSAAGGVSGLIKKISPK